MIQVEFSILTTRLKDLSKIGDPLEKLNKVINWEDFREPLEKIIQCKNKTSRGGRPSYDCILMFKIIIIQILYDLSDEQTEFQIKDRLSFMRFLCLSLIDKVPDARTIWFFKEKLSQDNADKILFNEFENILAKSGFLARSGQIVDASIIKAPIRRTGKRDDELIKEGKNPKNWEKWSKAKKAQTDMHARWKKKRNKSYFGYKSHTNIDKEYGLIRKYKITSAAVYDGHSFKDIYIQSSDLPVYGDGAYRSQEIEQFIKDCHGKSNIQWNKPPNKQLCLTKRMCNKINSSIRIAVEHVYAKQKGCMKLFIRTIGLKRATLKIGLANLVYNFTRFEFLKRTS